MTYTCPRCAGSGSYSFNPIHGTRCLRCRGTGSVTKKPRAPTPKWAVFGQHRATGAWLRVYNVQARTKTEAIAKALQTYAVASADWRNTYDLQASTARALKWTDMADTSAIDWCQATTKEAA